MIWINCDKTKDYCKLKIWVKAVIERDKKCMKCGVTQNLQAHHVQKTNQRDKYYFDPEYGVCLCKDCHLEFHKLVGYYYSRENTLKYLNGCKNIGGIK